MFRVNGLNHLQLSGCNGQQMSARAAVIKSFVSDKLHNSVTHASTCWGWSIRDLTGFNLLGERSKSVTWGDSLFIILAKWQTSCDKNGLVSAGNTGDDWNDEAPAWSTNWHFALERVCVCVGGCSANKEGSRSSTDVDAPTWLLLPINEVLHPVDVVEPQGDGGDEALQRDLDGQAEVLLQQGAGQSSHCLWFFKIHTGGETKMHVLFLHPTSCPWGIMVIYKKLVYSICGVFFQQVDVNIIPVSHTEVWTHHFALRIILTWPLADPLWFSPMRPPDSDLPNTALH